MTNVQSETDKVLTERNSGFYETLIFGSGGMIVGTVRIVAAVLAFVVIGGSFFHFVQ